MGTTNNRLTGSVGVENDAVVVYVLMVCLVNVLLGLFSIFSVRSFAQQSDMPRMPWRGEASRRATPAPPEVCIPVHPVLAMSLWQNMKTCK